MPPVNRLRAQRLRLHGPGRTLVLELGRPADWGRLSGVWRGVQTDLGLPAPAIAVSGSDAYQLWFSLATPPSPADARAFLDGLCARWLADLPPGRLRRHPTDPGAAVPDVPALQPATGNWSAFVAPDLAPVFSDTPWLDIPPGDDAQADVLSPLHVTAPDAWAAAVALLRGAPAAAEVDLPLEPVPSPTATQPAPGHGLDARQFLQRVMNDESVALALRIDAAKALLAAPPR